VIYEANLSAQLFNFVRRTRDPVVAVVRNRSNLNLWVSDRGRGARLDERVRDHGYRTGSDRQPVHISNGAAIAPGEIEPDPEPILRARHRDEGVESPLEQDKEIKILEPRRGSKKTSPHAPFEHTVYANRWCCIELPAVAREPRPC
jgi:hypothetical protein